MIAALGENVPMTAVRSRDEVIAAQRRADTGGDRLLADVRMGATDDVARLHQLQRPFLEAADQPHRPGELARRLRHG